jgi:hypothetical protein
VDTQAQLLLRAGDLGGFLQRRGGLIEMLVRSHVDQMAEWGARDGQAISDMIRAAV